jgi:hypothetical protein
VTESFEFLNVITLLVERVNNFEDVIASVRMLSLSFGQALFVLANISNEKVPFE